MSSGLQLPTHPFLQFIWAVDPFALLWIVALTILFLLALPIHAEPNADQAIVVGEPKVFDDRDLEILLEDLERQLRGLNTVDQGKILAALENLQGSQARSRQTGVELNPLALPGTEEAQEAGDDGTLAPKTLTTTTSEQTPATPDLGAAPSLGLPVSGFGSSAQDLLTRQIDLQYQIANIQMLLDRSVSDRFFDGGENGEGTPGARLMAVVGFQISLRPSRSHKGMAAQVEIEIESGTAGKRRPSLVALMPQQKTYNAASLSKKSNAFGAVAPVSAFTLGAGTRSSSETFYLYQDTDTYAFELPRRTDAPQKLRFGWQFRPVLGQPAVTPGLRQMFAVISLDERDIAVAENGPTSVPLKVTAETHWLKYSSKKRLPKGIAKLARSEYTDAPFKVPFTAHLQTSLTPKITEASLEHLGDGKALVKIRGENFSHDTSVAIGDQVLQPRSSAFVIRSNNQLQFIAPLADLLWEKVSLTGGRYGFPTLVRVAREETEGFRIHHFSPCERRKGGSRDLYVVLEPLQCQDPPDLLGRSVFLEFGGEIYELPAQSWHPASHTPCAGDSDPPQVAEGQLWSVVEVPYKLFETDQNLIATVPFLGENYRSGASYHPPVGITQIVLLDPGKPKGSTVWGLVGYGLDPIGAAVQIYVDNSQGTLLPKPEVVNPHLLKLTGPYEILASAKKATVFIPGLHDPQTLRTPTQPKPQAPPKILAEPTVRKLSSAGATFKGENLQTIQRVEFEGTVLKHSAKSSSITVFLTRDVTKEAGPVTLLGYTSETAFLPLNLTVQ